MNRDERMENYLERGLSLEDINYLEGERLPVEDSLPDDDGPDYYPDGEVDESLPDYLHPPVAAVAHSELRSVAEGLSQLCPERFGLVVGDGFWELHFRGTGGWLLWATSAGEQAEHDLLFGELWRECVARDWRPAVDWEPDAPVLAVLYGTHAHGTKNNASGRGDTPGLALAKAFLNAVQP